MKRTMFFFLALVWALVGVAQAQKTYVLLSEDFEELTLGPNVDEALPGDHVWTKTAPAGWTIDDTGVPGAGTAQDGVTEWAGWSFTDRVWWTTTAADQNRSQFTKGVGTVAVADPDEWDDSAHAAGRYNTYLSTPVLDISNAVAGTVVLTFDSSWRPEFADYGEQSANLNVSFDGAPAEQLFLWLSDATSPNYKTDATNETVTIKINNPVGAKTMVLTFGLFNCGNNWWWAIDNVVVTAKWSGVRASHPHPSDGAKDVAVKSALSWTPGEYVGGSSPQHRVLLSSDLNAVNDGTAVVSTQDANSYDATGHLDFSTTYYWRIDEANSAIGWNEGNVWSFTTEPLAYPLKGVTATASSAQANMGPEKTIDGSGLTGDLHGTEGTTMWLSTGAQPNWIQYQFDKVYKLHDLKVWNSNQLIESFLGFGAKSVTVEYSTDATTWTALDNVPEFTKALGVAGYAADTTVNFDGVMAQYVKLTINSTWGGMGVTGLSEVRFSYIPVQAREPQPADGEAGVSADATLVWRAGREAASHKIYFGSDKQVVADATAPVETVSEASYTPDGLLFGNTYYWKVDEVNAVTYPGDVWTFTIQAYGPIDDFEGYNDDDSRIYDSWIDGLTDPAKGGSQVGYDVAPFAERTVVRAGKQSMPLTYDNSASPFYSEAERIFDSPQNWTAHGADSLCVYFQGATQTPANSAEGLYLTVKDNSGKSKTVANPNAAATTATGWQQWKIPLSEFTSAGVKMTAVKTIAVGVGNRTSPAKGGAGKIFIDDVGFGRSTQ